MFTPAKVGQIVVPISPAAISGLDAQSIASAVAPEIIRAAEAAGGSPIGAPELLREDELRSRTDDPAILRNIDDHPGRLWVVADMIPIAQASAIARERGTSQALEVVAPPVLRRSRHRRR